MNARFAYQSTTTMSWTRIDMLLVIYEKLVTHLQTGIQLLEQHRAAELATVGFDVHRCLVTIVEGLNPEVDETPEQIMRLCLFVMDQIQTDSIEGWQASLRVMQTLKEGFEQIQNVAREAEYSGQIPALDVISN